LGFTDLICVIAMNGFCMGIIVKKFGLFAEDLPKKSTQWWKPYYFYFCKISANIAV